MVCLLLLNACSDDSAPVDETSPSTVRLAGTRSAPEPVLGPPAPCAPGQAGFVSGYQDFPGLGCPAIAATVAGYTGRIGFRRQCLRLGGAATRPKLVARVQVQECGPLRGKPGHYASMKVCCEEQAGGGQRMAATAFEPNLECPADRVRALAADLHYPGLDCTAAAVDVGSSLDSSHYRRACAMVASSHSGRQSISAAALFNCRGAAEPATGVMVDVLLIERGAAIDALSANGRIPADMTDDATIKVLLRPGVARPVLDAQPTPRSIRNRE